MLAHRTTATVVAASWLNHDTEVPIVDQRVRLYRLTLLM